MLQRLKKAIKKESFIPAEILWFKKNHEVGLLTGAVIGYKQAIEEFDKKLIKVEEK